MDESEWLNSTDLRAMWRHMQELPNRGRKMRMFGVASSLHIKNLVTDVRCQRGIQVAERYANGEARDDEAYAAADEAHQVADEIQRTLAPGMHVKQFVGHYVSLMVFWLLKYQPDHAASAAIWAAQAVAWNTAPHPCPIHERDTIERAELALHCGLARDIFGNPFRPVAVNPAWRTWSDGTVAKLAQTIYDDRRFDRMPILADALEEAGCDNAGILIHCRGPGPHVRGCWVVDLLLGKE